MIVATKDYPKSVAYTFEDGTIVRVRKPSYFRPGNNHDAQEMARKACLIRASEDYEAKELASSIASVSHHARLLKRYAKKIQSGEGPLAQAAVASRYSHPGQMSKNLMKAAKAISHAIAAVTSTGFLDDVSTWHNEQAPEEVETPIEPKPIEPKPVNRLKATMNGKPALNGAH